MPRKRRSKNAGIRALGGLGYVPAAKHEAELLDKVEFADGEAVPEPEVVEEKKKRLRNRGLTFAKKGAALTPIFDKIASQDAKLKGLAGRKDAEAKEKETQAQKDKVEDFSEGRSGHLKASKKAKERNDTKEALRVQAEIQEAIDKEDTAIETHEFSADGTKADSEPTTASEARERASGDDSDALVEDELSDGFEIDGDFFDEEDLVPKTFTTLAVDVKEFSDSEVSVSDEEDSLEKRYLKERSRKLRAADKARAKAATAEASAKADAEAADGEPLEAQDADLSILGKKNKKRAEALSEEWTATRLSKPLLKAIKELGYSKPTPIQKEAIPFALLGRDVLGIAETGSGKTAAFCLPILERLLQSPNVKGRRVTSAGIRGGRAVTKVMMISPTRELAVQTFDVLTNLSRYTMVTRALVAGGVDNVRQLEHLRQQPDIVVGTPGRIIDVALNAQNVYFEFLEIMVLDEADRLLDLGFRQAVIHILKECATPTRQTLLFSATLQDDVLDLAALALKKPVKVQVNKSHHVCDKLEQHFLGVQDWEDFDAALLHLLTMDKPIRGAKTEIPVLSDRKKFPKIIAFFKTKKSCHRTSVALTQLGITHFELHGDLSQAKRLSNLRSFHVASEAVILASDVAARGIDVENVSAVINLGLPADATRYVHRVGRTARIGNKGVSVTVFAQQERAAAKRMFKAVSKKAKGEKTDSLPAVKVNKSTIEPWKAKLAKIDKDIRNVIKEEYREKEREKVERMVQLSRNLDAFVEEKLRQPERQYVEHGKSELEGQAKRMLDDFMGKVKQKPKRQKKA